MSIVRIAHAAPQPGRLANGEFQTRGHLVVLADDAGHRAVSMWLRGEPGVSELARLVESGAGQPEEAIAADVPELLTARMLGAAGASVTGVDIDLTEADAGELSPRVTVARVGLEGGAGARQVTAELCVGLALAAAAGAPVRVPDAVLDRLAAPVTGGDLLTQFLDRVPPSARALPGGGLAGWPMPGKRPRFEPRNLDFAAGLDRWDLDPRPAAPAGAQDTRDYSAAADGASAVLSAGLPRPAGAAALLQTIFAEDYRGATVVFRGEMRTERGNAQAGLHLEILRHWWANGRAREVHGRTISGGSPWAGYEISAPIPEDADLIRFGVTLVGPGQVALRNPEFARAGLAAPEAGSTGTGAGQSHDG